jgi:hypothetical protein
MKEKEFLMGHFQKVFAVHRSAKELTLGSRPKRVLLQKSVESSFRLRHGQRFRRVRRFAVAL